MVFARFGHCGERQSHRSRQAHIFFTHKGKFIKISITDDTVRFHAEKHGCIAIYSSSTLYLLQGVPLSSLAHIEEEKGKTCKVKSISN
jgi:hypothetical protein